MSQNQLNGMPTIAPPTVTELSVVRSTGRRIVRRWRMRLAAWIMGDDWHAVIMRLWLIHARAKTAITREGAVILADCPALAEALYEPMPGCWELTVTHVPRNAGDADA